MSFAPLDGRSRRSRLAEGRRLVAALTPGVAICVAISGVAVGLQGLQARLFGRPALEALVLAILGGAAVRSFWRPSARYAPGIGFSGKTLLEVAVVLLGAGVGARALIGAGASLLAGVVGVVVAAIPVSYGLGRLFGLPHRMATLIACGNAICGNSAIAAVAPVIGADSDDVAASIAFTAILGVVVVLTLPLIAVAWRLSPQGYGVLAGLTVYAVPQVLAATAPISTISAQVGTLVKLVRVLMLGPVVLILSLVSPGARDGRADGRSPGPGRLVPWFIVGFLMMIAARSAGAIPSELSTPAATLATGLTILSMAALGLGVDVRMIARAGPRVTIVVGLSLLALGVIALGLIGSLKLG